MENHLKRVLDLVRRTGDTMVVVDKDSNDSFVVMDLDRYEMLLDAQEGFEDDVEESDFQPESSVKSAMGGNIWDVMQEAGDEGETWDIDQLSEEEFTELEKQYQDFARGHVEEAVEETKKLQKQEEMPNAKNVGKSLDDDEYGEEQFYLEPVE
ncbi:hypothetical protein EPN81_00755 [Patescibacteria group bacterium]|nr:MAG: hypothetical protein EPN81_00755 [Patescibacteria group bacterium]